MVFGGGGEGGGEYTVRDFRKLTTNLLPVKKGEVHNGITEHNGEIRLISL